MMNSEEIKARLPLLDDVTVYTSVGDKGDTTIWYFRKQGSDKLAITIVKDGTEENALLTVEEGLREAGWLKAK